MSDLKSCKMCPEKTPVHKITLDGKHYLQCPNCNWTPLGVAETYEDAVKEWNW